MDSVTEGHIDNFHTMFREVNDEIETLQHKCSEQEKIIEQLQDELKTQSSALRAFAQTTTETLQHVDHNQREIVRAINNGLKLEEPGDENSE